MEIIYNLRGDKVIRKATTEDASRIAEILIFSKRMAYSDIFCDYKVSFGEMQVLPLALEFVNCEDKLENIYVFEDIVVKGMMRISIKNTFIEINELYVEPFFKSQGIGTELLKYAESIALSLNYSYINLWVLEKNTNARKYYEKHYFHNTGEKKLEEGTSEYIYRYEKNI